MTTWDYGNIFHFFKAMTNSGARVDAPVHQNELEDIIRRGVNSHCARKTKRLAIF